MPIDHRTESMPGIPAATITTPVNDTRVKDSVLVKGTAHNIQGEQYYLWLVLYHYDSNRHYPQNGPVVVSSDGQWETTAFFESIGRYDIAAVAADQNANEILVQYQAATTSRADYQGLPGLPPGCIALALVTVSGT